MNSIEFEGIEIEQIVASLRKSHEALELDRLMYEGKSRASCIPYAVDSRKDCPVDWNQTSPKLAKLLQIQQKELEKVIGKLEKLKTGDHRVTIK